MEFLEFEKELKNKANKININLTEKQIENFYNYMELLLEWNEKINLTAITDKKEIIQKHFIDSITINKYITKNDKILDIGTGAGFPGIPLKIINQDSKIILLDSLNKRINFLNEVIEKLEIKNVYAIHGRAEDFVKQTGERESFDIVTSRAVAGLNVLLEYMLPFTKIGGICICMKGINAEDEIEKSKKAIEILGGKIEKIEEVYLPDSDILRKNIIIRKIRKTPENFPRKAGVPSKEPIE